MTTTANKTAAKEVYTPDHSNRVVSAAESVPSLSTDGTDCSGFNVLAVSRTLTLATTVDFALYYYDGAGWLVAEDSTALAVDDYDPTAASFFQQYNIAGVFRYKFVVTATDGTLRVAENLSI